MLRSRPAVFVGLISYSLYLWHWPVIAYLNYLQIAITPAVGAVVLVASVALSCATWRYIEKPARKHGNMLPLARVFVRRLAIPVCSVAVFASGVTASQGFPGRFDPKVTEMERAALARPNEIRSGCHVPTALYDTPPNPARCRLGATKDRPDGILLGDSYANHFSAMVDVLATRGSLSIMDYTMDGCPPLLDYDNGLKGSYSDKCKARNLAAVEYVKRQRIGRVILAGHWPASEEAGAALIKTVEAYIGVGAEATIIISNSSIDGAGSCAVRALMYGSLARCTAPRVSPPGYMEVLEKRQPKVRFVDPNEAMCPEGECQSVLLGHLLYRDSGHLNYNGSAFVGSLLAERGVSL